MRNFAIGVILLISSYLFGSCQGFNPQDKVPKMIAKSFYDSLAKENILQKAAMDTLLGNNILLRGSLEKQADKMAHVDYLSKATKVDSLLARNKLITDSLIRQNLRVNLVRHYTDIVMSSPKRMITTPQSSNLVWLVGWINNQCMPGYTTRIHKIAKPKKATISH